MMSDGARRFYYYNNLLKSYPQERWVKLTAGELIVYYLIDTRVTCSDVNTPLSESLWQAVTVTGISEGPESQFFLKPLECAMGDMFLTHKFLYIVECLILLLEGDLLSKLHVQITFSSGPSTACSAVPYETMGEEKK